MQFEAIATVAPASMHPRAQARPMPDAAPVIAVSADTGQFLLQYGEAVSRLAVDANATIAQLTDALRSIDALVDAESNSLFTVTAVDGAFTVAFDDADPDQLRAVYFQDDWISLQDLDGDNPELEPK